MYGLINFTKIIYKKPRIQSAYLFLSPHNMESTLIEPQLLDFISHVGVLIRLLLNIYRIHSGSKLKS